MATGQRESRPRATDGFSDDRVGTGSTPILATSTPNTTDDVSAQTYFTNCHAVVVFGKVARRRLYFSLHSAERAVERAHARGDHAEMILVELVPVRGEP
jgi:hypothetical protein